MVARSYSFAADELGDAWRGGRLHARVRSNYNGTVVGDCDSGPEMHFSFPDLIQHVSKTRRFVAGTILGSGTVSNEDRKRGSSCLVEKRMIEQIDTGKTVTPWMKAGDSVTIEMFDKDGASIFGRIAQNLVAR